MIIFYTLVTLIFSTSFLDYTYAFFFFLKKTCDCHLEQSYVFTS